MIRLDYTNMMASAVAAGLADADLRAAGDAVTRAVTRTRARHASGELGFFDLPADRPLLDQSTAVSRYTQVRDITDAVVLGIGGSALGPIALRTALRPQGWNLLDTSGRAGWPRLHVLDNVDPVTIAAHLERLDLKRTIFIVTSKSGGTAETMAQYLIVRRKLEEAKLKLQEHLVFITDPVRGALRPIATAEAITTADIPANVGGRFSVLSPVGILPAAVIGIDVGLMLMGAEDMNKRCQVDDWMQNPAAVFAALQWLADTERDRRINVLMPYSDPLRDMAAWFVQLWAESLGKVRPSGASVGPTPVPALGATDQHSQVQLFMEGPPDKTVTFLTVEHDARDVEIPALHADVPDLAYLGGHTLGELIRVEQRATAGALARRGCLNMNISMERVDPWHVGGLIMLFEIATAYAGELYGVNAFDQPGVELGKRFTYAMLGRPGFDGARAEWEQLPASDERYRC